MASVWADGGPDAQPTGAEPAPGAARSQSLTEVDEDDLEDEEPSQRTSNLSWAVRGRFQGAAAAGYPDGEGSLENINSLPRILRDRFQGGLATAGDAYEACQLLMNEQLQRAISKQPPPNVPVQGDAVARTAFQLLLTDEQQRALFLQLASSPVAWPRLRSLIGAPPYNFLRSEDAGTLNASGFARGRSHMVYEGDGKRVANYSQFGPGQLVDEHAREYRVAPTSTQSSDPLPSAEYFRGSSTGHILHVKVRRHGVQKKRELLRSEQRKQLFFPQPGETIVLQETRPLLAVSGARTVGRVSLRVKALWPRSNGASTAAVLVSV